MTRTIETIDAHVAGEPLRVITGGWPELEGATMLEKRRFVRANHDALRRALMWEPRGHADMYGALLTEPENPDSHCGVLFMHNEGWSTMCGHGIIGLATVALQHDLIGGQRHDLRIDTPAGLVTARAERDGWRVRRVRFRNVPSFVLARNSVVEIPDLGSVHCDIAFGGTFYAYVDAAVMGVELVPSNLPRLIDLGRSIKQSITRRETIRHPAGAPDLGFLYGTIFVGPARGQAHSRNVCVFADGEVDRSPTGTGVSGRAAILHAAGEIAVGETITVESLIGTRFDVRVLEATEVGGLPAVIPEVSGTAWVTGRHEFWIDPADPVHAGFLLR